MSTESQKGKTLEEHLISTQNGDGLNIRIEGRNSQSNLRHLYAHPHNQNGQSHDYLICGNAVALLDQNLECTQGFGFGFAIEALKAGKKVARQGWNGKGMYLWLLPATEVKKEWVKDPQLLSVFGERDTLPCLASIRMKTATGEVLTGWLASQTDMMAEDWVLVP